MAVVDGHCHLLLLILIILNDHCTAAFCPERCECNDTVLQAVCIDAQLDVMPNALNPAIKSIVYRGNSFSSVDVSLRFLPQLQFVDLSDNRLMTLDDGAFSSQTQLLTLKVDNNKVAEVSKGTFNGLRRLQLLSIRGNFIEHLPPQAFAPTAQTLVELNLGQNRIKSVDPLAFEDLSMLQRLHLDSNKLHSVPYEAFKPLRNLLELNVAANPLKTLASSSSSYFPRSLRRLDLSSCRLQSLSSSSLSSMASSLRYLRLDNNLFRTLPDLSLLSSLETLHLARNPITRLPANAFQGQLSRLRHLSVKDCDLLTEVEANAFAHLNRLQRLELSHNNRLEALPRRNLFELLPQLRRLDLSHNELNTLHRRAANWEALNEVRLEGNNWKCDCSLAFLADLNINDTGKAKCASPHDKRSWSIFSQAVILREQCHDKDNDEDDNVNEDDKGESSSMGANQPHRMDDEDHEGLRSNVTVSVILLLLAALVIVVSLIVLVAILCRRFGRSTKNTNNKPWKASAPHVVHSHMLPPGFGPSNCPNASYLLSDSNVGSPTSPTTTTTVSTMPITSSQQQQQQQFFFDCEAPPLPPRLYSASTSSSVNVASSSEDNDDDLRYCDPHILVEQRRREALFKGERLPVTEL